MKQEASTLIIIRIPLNLNKLNAMRYTILIFACLCSQLVLLGQQVSKSLEFSSFTDYGLEIFEYENEFIISIGGLCDWPKDSKYCYGIATITKQGDTVMTRFVKTKDSEKDLHIPKNNICFNKDTIVFATNIIDNDNKTFIRSFKYDNKGNLIRSKEYVFPNNVKNYGMVKTQNGYIVHGGYSLSPNRLDYLLVLDENLDSLGLKIVGTDCSTTFSVMTKTNTGDNIFARLYDCFGDIIDIYSFDSTLNLNWQIPWLIDNENTFSKYGDDYIDIKTTQNDDIILISDYITKTGFPSIDSSEFPPLITKISKEGQQLWQKRLYTKYLKNSSHIQLAKNDDILFVGSTEYFTMYGKNIYPDGFGSWVALYDSTLNKKWDRFIFDHRHPYGCSLSGGVVNQDGSFAFTGVVTDTVTNAVKLTFNNNTWFLTLDSLGCFNGDCGDVLIFNKPKVANGEIQTFDQQIYPNPTNGILNFINPIMQKTSFIRIFSATGQMVMEANLPSGVPLLQIHLEENLSNGLYFLHQFDQGKVIYSGKFLLER